MYSTCSTAPDIVVLAGTGDSESYFRTLPHCAPCHAMPCHIPPPACRCIPAPCSLGGNTRVDNSNPHLLSSPGPGPDTRSLYVAKAKRTVEGTADGEDPVYPVSRNAPAA